MKMSRNEINVAGQRSIENGGERDDAIKFEKFKRDVR